MSSANVENKCSNDPAIMKPTAATDEYAATADAYPIMKPKMVLTALQTVTLKNE